MNLHYLLMCGGLYMLFGRHESMIHSNQIGKSKHNAPTGDEAPGAALAGETAPNLGNKPLPAKRNSKALPHDHLRQLISATEVLGRLIVISSGTDFDLGQGTLANHGLLIHSGFRPSMVQVTNEAWKVLRWTRDNLRSLKRKMDKLPQAITQVLGALAAGNTTKVSENLHIMASFAEDGDEYVQRNEKELRELMDFFVETTNRLAGKLKELQIALKHQEISGGCEEKRMSAVRSAIVAATKLKDNLVNAVDLFNREVEGSMRVVLKQGYESFSETVKTVSTLPKAVSYPTVRKDLANRANYLVSGTMHLQALAGEYIYVSDRCLLSAARFRLFSSLQHLPKGQAVLKLDQLVSGNKAAWNDTEAFSKRQREENKQKMDEYKRQIAAILKPSEIGAAGLSGTSFLGKQSE